jgi:hypothetical protein
MAGRYRALAQPREIRGDLLYSKVIELHLNPSCARAEHARELMELIANALTHVERLMFFAEADRC